METLFIKQLRKCGHLKENLALYELEVTQKGVPRSYDRLIGIVRTHLEARRKSFRGVDCHFDHPAKD
eukprot:3837716-Karenia_brevis.AAC.1